MDFKPRSEKEINEMNLWPAGEYPFEITQAVDCMSKSNNEMIQLKLKVFNAEGGFKFVDDYLVAIDSMAYKIRHCAAACGLMNEYENGRLVAEDFKDRTGRLKLTIQVDKNGKYADKNTVKDYVVPVEVNGHATPASGVFMPPGFDDDFAIMG